MEQMIEAYRRVSASDELKEVERLRERARRKGIMEVAKNFKNAGFDNAVDVRIHIRYLTFANVKQL